jgi:hypothetical protein
LRPEEGERSVALRFLEEHTLQLNDLRGTGHTVYVRLGDAFPSDGWGGWLARVKLVMERG